MDKSVRLRENRGKRQDSMRPKLPEDELPKYPNRKVLYNPDTLIGELINTLEEQEGALASGKWIEHPKMSLEDWREKRKEVVEEEEEHINYAEKIRFRDANKPRNPSADKRYVSQMNVGELIEKGKELGLDFGTPETCPTKMKMKRQIKKAGNK